MRFRPISGKGFFCKSHSMSGALFDIAQLIVECSVHNSLLRLSICKEVCGGGGYMIGYVMGCSVLTLF